jgi:hypothetical protein
LNEEEENKKKERERERDLMLTVEPLALNWLVLFQLPVCVHGGWEEASRFLLFSIATPFFFLSLSTTRLAKWVAPPLSPQAEKETKKKYTGRKKKKDSIGTHTRELGSSNLMHTHTWGWDIAASAHPCDFVSTVIQPALGPPISLFQTVSYLGEDSFSFSYSFIYISFIYLFIYLFIFTFLSLGGRRDVGQKTRS